MGKLQLHKLKNRNSVVVKETALNIKNIEEFLPENGKTLILCSKRMSKTDIVKEKK